MRLFIPPLGSEVILSEPWTFTIWDEYRNYDALIYFKLIKERDGTWGRYLNTDETDYPLTLPAGTLLKIDRIFIRKGSKDYDSVTFYLKGMKKRIRFWAKLADVNRMEIHNVET